MSGRRFEWWLGALSIIAAVASLLSPQPDYGILALAILCSYITLTIRVRLRSVYERWLRWRLKFPLVYVGCIWLMLLMSILNWIVTVQTGYGYVFGWLDLSY